jgi:hypothetical protein
MPCISRFFGIAIYLYYGDHAPPHFHAIYGEYMAEVEIGSGKVIDGWLPKRALRFVREWAAIHREDLEENWRRARAERALRPIPPLGSGN